MFRPLSLFIGLRYTRAKRRNHFISFISLMSMMGIALGVIVLITVLSVMNGFDREIKKRVFGMVPAITITSDVGFVRNWEKAQDIIQKTPQVMATAPFISGEALLTNADRVQPAMMNGILPAEEIKISKLTENMIEGKLTSLMPHQFGIVLGEDLANRLNVRVGDKITVITPQLSLTPAGAIPRFKRFTVTGIFHAGSGFGFDLALSFIHLSDAQTLFQMGTSITGLHANIDNIYAAPHIGQTIEERLGPFARVSDWTDQFGAFFHAVKLEKTMMFFILMLIIAVAVFNMVSSLVMVVNDKEADIAILRTFGATPRMIMRIFIVQGTIIGVTGTLLGVIGGIALALNVTDLVKGIENLFHVQFISSSVYFVNYLPSELQWVDVGKISLVALSLSLIATIYPAWRASRTEPVEALRYE
jgi:lipoprotein-releasing system permease protein